MLTSIVPAEACESMTSEQIEEVLDKVVVEHRATTPYDDDEYWLAQSPFDERYYLFASQPGTGWPTRPVDILSRRPDFFDED